MKNGRWQNDRLKILFRQGDNSVRELDIIITLNFITKRKKKYSNHNPHNYYGMISLTSFASSISSVIKSDDAIIGIEFSVNQFCSSIFLCPSSYASLDS